jgi:hypothetical protein
VQFSVEMSSLPYRQDLLPSVRAFVEHLAAEFPKPVRNAVLSQEVSLTASRMTGSLVMETST